ncbi:hypothetical protein scyTo_0013671 [Scyliorhinus torazame]|uniref:Uncharacterized protein n=1 Tax=Scyliorhinus torazame TaxID=75743 RepID=A0A401P268_SCYTO|nr:hypothetical protein [Scyliorhinus torazame]
MLDHLEEIAKWGTQYAGERRNLSPSPTRPLSRSSSRPSSRAGCARPSLTVAEREVVVLELLSQILQTDSLQAVQQWLLITGAKEKDMVLDLIRMAVANMRFGSAACHNVKNWTQSQRKNQVQVTKPTV